jgi:methyl-accepting chemotaxis protein
MAGTKSQADIEKAFGYLAATAEFVAQYEADGLIDGAAERDVYDRLAGNLQAYLAYVNQGQALVAAGDFDGLAALVYSSELASAYATLRASINEIYQLNDTAAQGYNDEIIGSVGDTIFMMAFIFGVAAVATLAIAWLVSGSIVKPIRYVVDAARRIADGDIGFSIDYAARAEIGDLVSSFKEMTNHLRASMSEIDRVAAVLSSASAELKGSAGLIASGVSGQVDHVHEISGTVSELLGLSNTNRAEIESCGATSERVSSRTNAGYSKMKEMTEAMNGIKEASNNISGVISIIGDIAFQTNILALNAAVEAARAGAHGKGFAVVAEEVRNLAQRSETSAKDTEALIVETRAKVEYGLAVVAETESILKDIVSGVGGISSQMSDMTREVVAEDSGIKQTLDVINALTENLQNSASLAEEISAMSDQLAVTVDDLGMAVEHFNLEGSGV